MELIKEYRFEAAHRLPNVPEGHQCGRPHGHSYKVAIHVEGEIDETAGWVVDYADISAVVKPVIEELDHHTLETIPGLENPTSEHLARWLWARIEPEVPLLSAVTVHETATSACVYRGV
jgi:6-pyruvoyltetrahydropterin/6-carboxytetrahydropterin synthase